MSQLSLPSSSKQYSSLDAVLRAIRNMKDDPLADAGTNIVISRGNPEAKLLLIGEAPGPQENIKGKPFVGPAGQMLDKVLLSANFDPEKDVYITNSVFRMPPGADGKAFRKPSNQEVEYYRPFVLEIIRLIDPLLILLTGNIACQSVLDKTGITSLRGQWFQAGGRWLSWVDSPGRMSMQPFMWVRARFRFWFHALLAV